MCPYLMFIGVAPRVRNKAILIGLACALLISRLLAGLDALIPERSTAGVALIFQPVFALGLVLVTAVMTSRGRT